jgi:hypothetical protein
MDIGWQTISMMKCGILMESICLDLIVLIVVAMQLRRVFRNGGSLKPVLGI